MAMNKLLGYIVSVVGIIILALSFSQVRTALNLTLPAALSDTILIIAGLVVLAIGAFIISKGGGSKKGAEVPIYHGKEIVGYRRI